MIKKRELIEKVPEEAKRVAEIHPEPIKFIAYDSEDYKYE